MTIGKVKLLAFSEGTSVSAPTSPLVSASGLTTYVNDAAFVSAKGSVAAEGDTYWNTTLHQERAHNGTAWVTILNADTNNNLAIDNLVEGFATTATAGGTTTLTVDDKFQQYFTGTLAQTVTLPVASTLVLGFQFQIVNLSTGTVTVNSSGANAVASLSANQVATVTCILASGTGAASWNVALSTLNGSSSGAGEKNYIVNASTATLWTASNTGITVGNTTSSLPRPNTTATGILITGVTGTTDYVYYRFILDDADAGKKLKFQFDMRPGTMVASDFEVRVYSNTASDYTTGNTRLSLSTDNTTPASLLPALTGTYRTTFDAPAVTAKWIEVRIKMAASQAHTMVISDVVVGPGVVTQGAAVSAWTSYTPLLRGDSNGSTFTNQTSTGNWRRVGDSIEVEVDILMTGTPGTATGAFTVDLPTGFSINTAVHAAATGRATLGVAAGSASGGATGYVGAVVATLAGYQTGAACVMIDSAAAAGRWSATVPRTWAVNDYLSLHFTVAVNEYAGAGTVNVVQNDVEYAYNTTSTDADDTTAFGYGPVGGTVGSFTVARNKRVRFQSPISTTDKLEVEINSGSGNGNAWLPVYQTRAGNLSYQNQNSVLYGIGIVENANGTDVDVQFETYAKPTGATYGAAGAAWSTLAGYQWRVKRSRGGQAVGFGEVVPGTSSGLVSASGLKGTGTSTTFGAGYVGETMESVGSAVAITTGGYANLGTLTLTPGVWAVSFHVAPVAAASLSRVDFGIATSTASATGWDLTRSSGSLYCSAVFCNGFGSRDVIYRVATGATTTIYLTAASAGANTTCNGSLAALRVG